MPTTALRIALAPSLALGTPDASAVERFQTGLLQIYAQFFAELSEPDARYLLEDPRIYRLKMAVGRLAEREGIIRSVVVDGAG